MSHILELYAENYKRLKVVKITPDGSVVEVTGRNAQGKSSVLDAIWAALQWRSAAKATEVPIREGEDQAMVRLDLGDMVVTRIWKDEGGGVAVRLIVEAKDGTPYKQPQAVLDALLGRLTFDPLAFIRAGSREQVSTLLSVVDTPVDLEALEHDRQQLYDARHLIGQEVRRKQGAFEEHPRFSSEGNDYADLPDAEADMSALLAAYQVVQDEITRHNDTRRDAESALRSYEDAERAVAEAEAALARAKERMAGARNDVDRANEAVDALGSVPEIGPAKQALEAAEKTNKEVREKKRWLELNADWKAAQGEWDAKDAEIAALDKAKEDALAAVQFPVEGLGFTIEGVTLNGLPLSQASQAEQLRVSLGIAMAANPDLRVLRITDGSLLDSESMAIIQAMADERDYQVWIERVDESGGVGVVIEDGKVAR
jgi:DNA repair exonuclease SbcCD ATPase subunit